MTTLSNRETEGDEGRERETKEGRGRRRKGEGDRGRETEGGRRREQEGGGGREGRREDLLILCMSLLDRYTRQLSFNCQ